MSVRRGTDPLGAPRAAALAAALALTALAASAPLGAQAAADRGPESRLARAALALPAGAPVRIAIDGRRLRGRVQRATADSIVLGGLEGVPVGAAIAAVDTLWVQRRETARGALIGGVTGGLALGALGVLFVAAICDSSSGCDEDYVRVGVAGAAVGGGAGALLGAGVGSLVRGWRRVHP